MSATGGEPSGPRASTSSTSTTPRSSTSCPSPRAARSPPSSCGFRDEAADITVTFDKLDVFRTPSEELVERLEERGHTVSCDDDPGIHALPELKTSFADNSSFEYPVDEEGDPLYFDYVPVSTEPVV
ncbi:hypothetical protein [Streptomyces flaveolus]|uniref:hypothetical protein n=1 Tax=Streptomyces flaveolus TaxID=67297 RepID=UPI0033DC77CB